MRHQLSPFSAWKLSSWVELVQKRRIGHLILLLLLLFVQIRLPGVDSRIIGSHRMIRRVMVTIMHPSNHMVHSSIILPLKSLMAVAIEEGSTEGIQELLIITSR
uniref:Uncharacterized protein n=1 Tax=Rhizophora mucronata TaxID=61149 RepID=A0A2P2LX53_RHIMU